MSTQCAELARVLGQQGLAVDVIRTNAPYRPPWVAGLRGVRALFRLAPYVKSLIRAARRADVAHVLANSGWAWYLLALPAIAIARWHRVPLIVHYHGGKAESFFASAPAWVRRSLGWADRLVVPSTYLRDVFARYGHDAEVIPNGIDLGRFVPRGDAHDPASPHLVITRNLEPVYDIPTGLHAFAAVVRRFPGARLTVAGEGPARAHLETLASELGVAERVTFCGRVDNERIHALYQSADLMLNPSTVDNVPVSILEAFASGVPVVTTDVGGVSRVAGHESTALLVPPKDPGTMAEAAIRLLGDDRLRGRLVGSALAESRKYGWDAVGRLWIEAYQRACARRPIRRGDNPDGPGSPRREHP
jgi:glycosyltransferase involved in cell wall biosynthesis